MQNNTGIYRYINRQNGESYVGQSLDLKHRHNEHLSLLRRGADGCVLLQRAWDKYGEDNFIYEIICFCLPEELDALEMKYIKEFNSYLDGYNCNKGGSGNSGFNHSDVTKVKIAKSSQGRRATPETLHRMSIAQKGRKISDTHRIALSGAWTTERRQQFSTSRSGANNPNFGRVSGDACNSVPIINNFGDFFFTAVDAAKWCGLKSPTNISSCLKGKKKSAGKHPDTNEPLIWRKATTEEIKLHK